MTKNVVIARMLAQQGALGSGIRGFSTKESLSLEAEPAKASISKKDAIRFDSIRRRQWHLLQQSTEQNLSAGANKEFRQVSVPSKILAFIKNHGLGRFREDRYQAAKDLKHNVKVPKQRYDKLFQYKDFTFLGSARTAASFPVPTLPEVSFLGRSNVGKSSLINALTNRKKAKVSAKPGYTRTINFFQLQNALRLVDLPGYGFALTKIEFRSNWHQLVKSYLTERSVLKRTCLLVDARHGLKQGDRDMISFFEENKIKFQIIMTKADLVDQMDLARRYTLIDNELKSKKYFLEPVVPCSSKNQTGISLLRAQLTSLAVRPPPTEGEEKEETGVPATTGLSSARILRAPKSKPVPLKQQEKTVQKRVVSRSSKAKKKK